MIGNVRDDGDAELSGVIQRIAAPVREQVAQRLRQAIVGGQLAPGERLVERELVERTGVSRTTIREVLRQLGAEGLVTSIPQRGVIVAILADDEAAELYEVRAELEGLAARRFVEQASEWQLDALVSAFEEVSAIMSAWDGTDVGALLSAKDRFYEVLMNGAANAVLHELRATLMGRISALRVASAGQPGRVGASLGEITALLRAIERRDAQAAAEAAHHHACMAAQAALKARADALERG